MILCATAGTAALVAAGLTAGLGVGGYYAGKAIDHSEVTYRMK